jgi:hypothetical protein
MGIKFWYAVIAIATLAAFFMAGFAFGKYW